jgi:uncharacterized membrane protein YqjE
LVFDIQRIRHHEYSVNVPPDYFVKKFNFLVSKSNSIKGWVRNGEFNGYVGPDFFPMNTALQLFYKLDFSVEEKDGDTQLRVTTALNPTFVWIGLITLMALVLGAIFNMVGNTGSILDVWLLFGLVFMGFAQWLILRDSRKKCLSQFSMLLHRVEAGYHNREPRT